ncbi:hypothetical protein KKB44_06585 [Candidatus Micrarchaeota archaeon]|nr:hypothetical protein [Candidatus Micrarchaeota archaeon]
MDFGKIIGASTKIIAIGTGIVLLGFILQAGSTLIQSLLNQLLGPASVIVGLVLFFIQTGYGLLSILLFFVLYFWAGMRAAKHYDQDAVGAGLVAVVSYLAVAIVHVILNLILVVVGIGGGAISGALSGGNMGPLGGAAMGAVGAGIFGVLSGVLTIFCGIGIIAIGMAINFCVGALGGLLGKK